MRKPLFEQYPDAMKQLSLRGYEAIVEMSKHMVKNSELAIGLNLSPNGGAPSKWFTMKNNPTRKNNTKAQKWLDTNFPRSKSVFSKPKPIATRSVEIIDPKPTQSGAVLMVVCPVGVEEKLFKILNILGCEVVEI